MKQHTRTAHRLQTTQYNRVRIAVAAGPDTGLTVEAAGCTLRVGTASDCDIVLHDDTVSRWHCDIELHEAGFRVRDAGSTNGVRVRGLQVLDARATEALELTLGETQLLITPLAETEERERTESDRFQDLIGSSRKMRELFAVLE